MTASKPVIGVIGGIGAGKSAAAAALARCGGRVIAADPAGHEALLDPVNRQQVARRWPQAVGPDGAIDRKILGRIVFADPAQLRELEGIVFPWITARLRKEIEIARRDPSVRFIVLDAALLLEAGIRDLCDRVVFVEAPLEVRIARVAQRGWSAEDLERRERTQVSLEEKKTQADAVLKNTAGLDELQENADALLVQWGLSPESI